jgi:hypothetical protein
MLGSKLTKITEQVTSNGIGTWIETWHGHLLPRLGFSKFSSLSHTNSNTIDLPKLGYDAITQTYIQPELLAASLNRQQTLWHSSVTERFIIITHINTQPAFTEK